MGLRSCPNQINHSLHLPPRLDKSCTHLELDSRLGTEGVVPGAAVVGNGWLWNLGTPPVAAWLIELAMGSCVTVAGRGVVNGPCGNEYMPM